MNNNEIKQFTLKLINAEKEIEVIKVLKEYNFLNNDKYWRAFGDNENNFSIIGAQQSSPDAALVEKIVNSVDAVLIRNSLEKDINPEGKDAPKTITDALYTFFNIVEGKLSNVSKAARSDLSKNIQLIVTGQKSAPNYCIVDKGEGQTPNRLPSTILSLSKSNKLRIPFVQGKFNMGGTGVLQFCGDKNFQLIISKRCPYIDDKFNLYDGKIDDSKNFWGVTLVKRSDPKKGEKSSSYEYLAPDNKIIRFEADSLPLLSNENLEWGTYIKLYDYRIGGLKTVATLNLYYALSVLLPNVALPIRIIETRDYGGHSLETTLTGLSVRLEEDRSKNLEDSFPYESELTVNGQKIKFSINVFKENRDENYRKSNEGVIFIINGQTHGFIPKSIYSRKAVGLGYIADSIITILDCSNLDLRSREDLFMNSRDKLRNVELKKKIEDILEDIFKNNPLLKKLQQERRKKALQNKISDSKPLENILKNIITKNPSLKNLLLMGGSILNPFETNEANGTEDEKYVGKTFPTYFNLKSNNETKKVPKNRKARIKFETDAKNNYFGRVENPGIINLTVNSQKVSDYSISLYNGRATLNIKLPNNVKVGDKLNYMVDVTDISQKAPFVEEFDIIVDKIAMKTKSRPGDANKKKNNTLAPPEIEEITKMEWPKYNMEKNGALRVLNARDAIYDFFINIDNENLLSEIALSKDSNELEVIKSQYKYGMALIGLSVIQYLNNVEEYENEEETDISKLVYDVTKIISPIFIPMIKSLGEINIFEGSSILST